MHKVQYKIMSLSWQQTFCPNVLRKRSSAFHRPHGVRERRFNKHTETQKTSGKDYTGSINTKTQKAWLKETQLRKVQSFMMMLMRIKKNSFLKKRLNDWVAKRDTEIEIMSIRPKGIETHWISVMENFSISKNSSSLWGSFIQSGIVPGAQWYFFLQTKGAFIISD